MTNLILVNRDELTELIERAVSGALGRIQQKQDHNLTPDEAAEYLRLPSKGSIYQLVHRKRLPYHKNGKRLTFKISDLDNFIQSGRKEANQQ